MNNNTNRYEKNQNYSKNYNQSNNFSQQNNYDNSNNYKNQKQNNNQNTNKTQKAFNQDLADDSYYDGDTYNESNFCEDNLNEQFDEFDDENYDEDVGGYGINNYNDDYLEDTGDFEDDFGVDTNKQKNNNSNSYKNKNDNYNNFANIKNLENKLSNTHISNNVSSKNINQNESQKNRLIFSNKDGFTNYIEDTLKQEKRNNQNISDSFVNVIMIAEKPSIAKAICDTLSGGRIKNKNFGKGGCLLQYDGYFFNTKAKFTVSSVMGHVYTSDFQRAHNKWGDIDYLDLYDVAINKVEANFKTKIPMKLQKLGTGKDILVLWLDCDKEGENICYEVIHNIYKNMNIKNYQQVYRAKFSSLTSKDLKAAFNNLNQGPNKNESLSVDARQVIDLKIGVSFTRFLTSAILPGLKNVESKVLSYGPCQTPTLWFCVNRQQEIDKFRSKEYFKILLTMEHNKLKHEIRYKDRYDIKSQIDGVIKKIREFKQGKVVKVHSNKIFKQPPAGLNTVQMLRTASSYLKMSPHETMIVAEKLYTMGFITYPRTETTKYAASFDFNKSINDFANHSVFGKQATGLLRNFKRPILRGVDVGDHPPITPAKVAEPTSLKGEQWRLYEFICSNFLASMSDQAEMEEKTMSIDVGGVVFEADSISFVKEGYLAFMPWKKKGYLRDFPILVEGSNVNILNVVAESKWTEPPEYLSESDLIKMMESNKIGTDASMAVHIQNISERGYVTVNIYIYI